MPGSKNISKVRLADFDPSDGLDRGAGKVKESLWYMVKVLFFLTALPIPQAFKAVLLSWFGAKIGHGITIKPRVNIHFPWKLELGDNSWIGEEVFILNFEQIKIGNNVCISQRAFLCGGNHDYRDPAFKYKNGPILIQDGAWVGANCFVGPNVTIGADSVITAGSVVTSSIGPNGIYKGNPAERVKNRWDDQHVNC